MFNKLEKEIINESRIPYFGAYLQCAWLEYPLLKKEITKNKFLELKRLKTLYKDMNQEKRNLDAVYFFYLSKQKINPLKTEQKAWKILSSITKDYLQGFDEYLKNYSETNMEKGKLLIQIEKWWNILQDWNILSNSFKAKLEYTGTSKKYRNFQKNRMKERERELKKLIKNLSSR